MCFLHKTSEMLVPCTVASTDTPQRLASSRASASSQVPISSAATTSGIHARIIMESASDLGQPSITSVRQPTSSWGTPSRHAAISRRSSATPIFSPSSDKERTSSRRSVVFPSPGGDTISALYLCAARIFPSTSSAQPQTSLGIRMQAEAIFARLSIPFFPTLTFPQTPTRKPCLVVK